MLITVLGLIDVVFVSFN